MLRWLLACALVARTTLAEVLDVSTLSDAELAEVAAAARDEMRKRQEPKSYPVFQYAHKQTFATSDPEGAAVFLRGHVGGTTNVTMTNMSHIEKPVRKGVRRRLLPGPAQENATHQGKGRGGLRGRRRSSGRVRMPSLRGKGHYGLWVVTGNVSVTTRPSR